ncbi:sigma 54-interacting transcriptional regulator [Anaerospora hongkongensis]|uniref:sigma 54-interacting transcriptional regulator n=1 Tax=Anaerospora hongkongensis TaxID=244830 RepID=UPI00289EBEA9|nr:sigma 54-interacting transcriptional regulator [Anaerospora hongkongensis]
MRSNWTILVVDDEESVRKLLTAVLKKEGYTVETAEDGRQAVEKARLIKPALVIMDIRMPNLDGLSAFKAIREENKEVLVILMTAFAAVETAVEAVKLGAYDYIIKPFNIDEVKLLIKRAMQVQTLTEEVKVLREELYSNYRLDKLLTNSPKMQELYRIIGKVASTSATVLLSGESGTGKELIANTIHYNSLRSHGPLVKVNCGALPESLLESELFGHEKGAFTGAAARKLGRFELANKGTIFLDEIGEVSQSLQVKLLRVLQEREFERVGGTELVKTDIRIIAATNRNLEDMVAKGTFREDLYYRLNVVSIHVPPLRERREDIPLLADYFLHKYAQENNRTMSMFDLETCSLLADYNWPGNVRELANVVERAVIMSTGCVIFPEDLPQALSRQQIVAMEASSDYTGQSLKEIIKQVERNVIKQALAHNNGNKVKTAKDLGMSRRALLYKIEEYELC